MESLKSKHYLILSFVVSLIFVSCSSTDKEADFKVEQGYALGTTYTIKYEATDEEQNLKPLIEAVFDTVNMSMSTYLPTSDISAINRGDSTIAVDKYFKEVYVTAKEVYKKTGGFFDPTIGALANAWGFGPEMAIDHMKKSEVDSLLEFTGFDKVYMSDDQRIIKKNKNIYLDFNALAKGYTIDLIGRMFDRNKVKNYLIEVGGEILTRGNSKTTNKVKNWVVAIDSPTQDTEQRVLIAKVQLKDKAMATSGNYRKFRVDEETGEHYVHIINPLTGYPQKSNVLSVSVVAQTCMVADAYATALMVMPLDKAKELLKSTSEIDAYIISADKDGDLVEYKTKGFQELLLD
ncbi:membrane-associated lipoprotein involved in thiamine biosynthesis [Galbibacter orientalis DSM 19592]|uniref:FAD:protein FMN transferase n=1 Tax=Galbibacter orientalis DSM 19592 TaxID=926559 RepID=I3C5I8_9FLAO|nr:FAD:protein FMN transferase [Galbibacter orientalis]EIJ38881.1 membrane-associated lipoprotein involved in thiamine biosynthesis [Galbibacter orientalis DSM 19592]